MSGVLTQPRSTCAPSLTKKVTHQCVRCQKEFPHGFNTFCDACDGMIDVRYDLTHATIRESASTLERYFDLLPIEDSRFLIAAPLPRTDCIHAARLGTAIGIPWLYLKDETSLPTGTTKDRMAVVALSFMRECGVTQFCTSSTGNSSTGFARVASMFPECRIFLFTGENWRHRVHFADSAQVVHFVLRDATFVDAFVCAASFAKRHGLSSERGFFNPGRREGLKLAFLEAAEQIPRPIDWYVQAISSAMGVYGCYKGAKELKVMGRIEQLPRLLCVQQESCAPMATAFADNSPVIRPQDIVHRPTGIAEAILRGDPSRAYPYIREIVLEGDGDILSVSESEIRAARQLIFDTEGIDPCFSASTAVAGLAKGVAIGKVPPNDTVMVNLTGSDRPDASASSNVHWLHLVGGEWMPEDPNNPVFIQPHA